MSHTTHHLDCVEAAVDHIIATVGRRIVLGMPLGLGKPNALANALYRRAKQDPSIALEILTALSLERPSSKPGMEARFMAPFVERVFGDFEDLDYMRDIRAGEVPANIHVCEFFFKSGGLIGNAYAQQHYISTNYTFAGGDMMRRGINVIAQIIAKRTSATDTSYSLACNPEIVLDLHPVLMERKRQGEKILFIGQVHNDLPFMVNDAEVASHFFDVVIDSPKYSTRLFGTPNLAISTTDYMIGLNASTLLRDGGTLQIGIGSLGDAIVHASQLRDAKNAIYTGILQDAGILEKNSAVIQRTGGTAPFAEGLYGSSEMFVSGFLELMKSGILRRRVYDYLPLQTLLSERAINETVDRQTLTQLVAQGMPAQLDQQGLALLQNYGILRADIVLDKQTLVLVDGQRVAADLSQTATLDALEKSGLGGTLKGGMIMHGGFFLGPTSFYEGLRNMSDAQRAAINMTRISYVNSLIGEQALKCQQRRDARFINTVFTATLLGAAASDGLPNGQVVSGVGGQYNFVAMAHDLPGAHSILLLRATRNKAGKVSSNIVLSYGNTTIPRHLRDIFITEYGIADLRAKSDAEVIAEMLNVADSRFQEELLEEAKKAGKIAEDYEIPVAYRQNTPERLEQYMAPYRTQGHFPPFPFGHDFTDEELVLGKALKALKATSADTLEFLQKLLISTTHPHIPEQLQPYLKRMDMENPSYMRDKLEQLLLAEALCEVLGIKR